MGSLCWVAFFCLISWSKRWRAHKLYHPFMITHQTGLPLSTKKNGESSYLKLCNAWIGLEQGFVLSLWTEFWRICDFFEFIVILTSRRRPNTYFRYRLCTLVFSLKIRMSLRYLIQHFGLSKISAICIRSWLVATAFQGPKCIFRRNASCLLYPFLPSPFTNTPILDAPWRTALSRMEIPIALCYRHIDKGFCLYSLFEQWGLWWPERLADLAFEHLIHWMVYF